MHDCISRQAAAIQVRAIAAIVARIREGQTPPELEIIEALEQGLAQLIELTRAHARCHLPDPIDGTRVTTTTAGALRGALEELRGVVGGDAGSRSGYGFVLPVTAAP